MLFTKAPFYHKQNRRQAQFLGKLAKILAFNYLMNIFNLLVANELVRVLGCPK